jgi:uridine phosphorylase
MKRVSYSAVLFALLFIAAATVHPSSAYPDLQENEDQAIVNPAPDANDPPVTPQVILTCSRQDFDLVCSLADATDPLSYIWDCPLRHGSWKGTPVTIAGPLIGAPHTIMVVEELIASGARMIIYFGYCGSLQSEVRIGDLLVPTSATIGEGTSNYYHPENFPPFPDPEVQQLLLNALTGVSATVHQGKVWTTDALYRETISLVQYYQGLGVKGVEMEMSAFFTLGKYRQVAVAGLLAVSDELFTLTWKPGFNTPIFQQARDLAARAVLDAAAAWGAKAIFPAYYLLWDQ